MTPNDHMSIASVYPLRSDLWTSLILYQYDNVEMTVDVRCSIVKSAYCSHHSSTIWFDVTSAAKISENNSMTDACAHHQNVLRLQVAMCNTLRMEIMNSYGNLSTNYASVEILKAVTIRLKKGKQVTSSSKLVEDVSKSIR
jgi:hypothetical protein